MCKKLSCLLIALFTLLVMGESNAHTRVQFFIGGPGPVIYPYAFMPSPYPYYPYPYPYEAYPYPPYFYHGFHHRHHHW